jgi:hypothetical protein
VEDWGVVARAWPVERDKSTVSAMVLFMGVVPPGMLKGGPCKTRTAATMRAYSV